MAYFINKISDDQLYARETTPVLVMCYTTVLLYIVYYMLYYYITDYII